MNILTPLELFFPPLLMFVLEVFSGAEKLLPVVIAPCICAVLVVFALDEEDWLCAPVSSAQGGPWCKTLKSDNKQAESKTKVHRLEFEPDEEVVNRLQKERGLCVEGLLYNSQT